MDGMSTADLIQAVGWLVTAASIAYYGGRLSGWIRASLERNVEEHEGFRKHQLAQDDLLRDHDRSIVQIRERIRLHGGSSGSVE